MALHEKNTGTLALRLIVGLALLAAPLGADPPAAAPTMVLQVVQGGSVSALAYSPDGKTLATGSNDSITRLWDTASGQIKAFLVSPPDIVFGIQRVVFTHDGRALATQGTGGLGSLGRIQLWDLSSGFLRSNLGGAQGPCDFSPDSRTLVIAIDGRSVQLWDVATANPLGTLEDVSWHFVLSPDSKTLVTGSADNEDVQIWDLASRQVVTTLPNAGDPAAISPDGKTLVCIDSHLGLHLWDMQSRRDRAALHGTHNNYGTIFSPDSTTLAMIDADHGSQIQLWDVESGDLVTTLKGHTDYVTALAFSPDGQMLASASADSTVRLWPELGLGPDLLLQGHKAWVNALAFAPDGKTLASGSDDGTVRLWVVGN